MKKFAALILAAVMLLGLPAYADTIIDHVLYTDIRTYINGVEISSFNIHNDTAVVVEDLAHYGFDVVWDGEARTLSVTRDASKEIAGMKTSSASVPTGGRIGDEAMPVYATDIKTYLDGNLTESFNVGGLTIVYVDDLAELYSTKSDYVWDGEARTLSMKLAGTAAVKENNTESSGSAYKVENGVYTNEWAGISFDVTGEWGTDSEGLDESVFTYEDFFMMYGDSVMVLAFTMVPGEETKELFSFLSEEELGALLAASIAAADADAGVPKLSSTELAGKTWWVTSMDESIGVPATAYFRIIDGKFFFIVAAAENAADVDGFVSGVRPYSQILPEPEQIDEISNVPVQTEITTPEPVETIPVNRTTPVSSSNTFGLHEVDPLYATYVCNTHTMKYHYLGCKNVPDILPENRLYVDNTSAEIEAAGFYACRNCH